MKRNVKMLKLLAKDLLRLEMEILIDVKADNDRKTNEYFSKILSNFIL